MHCQVEYTPSQVTVAGTILDINNGTADERVVISATSGGKINMLVRASAGDVASITSTTGLVIGVTQAIKFVLDTNNAELFINNSSEGTPDTSLVLPATPTVISVNQDYNAAGQTFGSVRRLRISRP